MLIKILLVIGIAGMFLTALFDRKHTAKFILQGIQNLGTIDSVQFEHRWQRMYRKIRTRSTKYRQYYEHFVEYLLSLVEKGFVYATHHGKRYLRKKLSNRNTISVSTREQTTTFIQQIKEHE